MTAPSNPLLTASAGAKSVALNWTAAADVHGAVVRFDTASPTGTVATWFPPTPGLTVSNVSVFPANPRVIRPLRGSLAQGFGDSGH